MHAGISTSKRHFLIRFLLDLKIGGCSKVNYAVFIAECPSRPCFWLDNNQPHNFHEVWTEIICPLVYEGALRVWCWYLKITRRMFLGLVSGEKQKRVVITIAMVLRISLLFLLLSAKYPHLSKGTSDLKQKCTQTLTSFLGHRFSCSFTWCHTFPVGEMQHRVAEFSYY